AVNELVSTLNLARSEAIKRGDRITVCKSADGAACTGSGGWDQGWIVFVDSDSDAVVDAGEEVLSVNGALDPPLTMIGNGNVANYVSFVHDGTTQTTSGALQMGTVTLCGSGVENEDREIVINNVGRTNLRKKTCS
ncbi:MAG: GspH/FimT family protein, partial [Pseudomonadota bacterium]|nr:GspH/FimT family protein [Pseudomonadota bacterium]